MITVLTFNALWKASKYTCKVHTQKKRNKHADQQLSSASQQKQKKSLMLQWLTNVHDNKEKL